MLPVTPPLPKPQPQIQMSPLRRKRPREAAPPEAPPAPATDADAGARATRKPTSAVTRRATRQTSAAVPQTPPWAADPMPRRRRRGEHHAHDEDEADEAAPVTKPPASLRGRGGRQARPRPRPVVAPPPEPSSSTHTGLTGTSGSTKSVRASGRGRGRGRPREDGRSARAASAAGAAPGPRPVLGATNQADPTLRPKPVMGSWALRHQRQHDAGDGDQPAAHHALVVNDTKHLVAPMQTHVDVDPAPLRRRGSAVGPSMTRASQPPPTTKTKTAQGHQPPISTIKTVPIMAQSQPRPLRMSDHVAANTSKPFIPATTGSDQPPPPPPRVTKRQATKHAAELQRKSSIIERNVEKVVFGNTCFSTWYHSPYGTEALGEISGNSVKAAGASAGAGASGTGVHHGGGKDDAISNPANRKAKEDKLDRLYVCPCCFKYSKELVPWWQHVHLCERRGYVPGEKIYTHPKGRQTHAGATNSIVAKGPGRKKRNLDGTLHVAEQEAENQGEWSVWQVDGEDEGLFCQNLSLFAKLFLDNKSVFFDVGGFHYFLLVHTTPGTPSEDGRESPPSKRQIVGFFSKEKLSWDNNNLACILVFPPWQRKGLGALLMGVSYEISRREGMLGGPEKPISDLGKKGYKRFWAGEIASWLLELDTGGDEEVVVDVDECSRATWIVPEDCLMVLREMGVVEEAEAGPPPKKKRCPDVSVPEEEEEEEDGEEPASSGKQEEVRDVPRVRISKDAVWTWVQANKISLEKACDPDGFVDGYAIKKAGVEEEDL